MVKRCCGNPISLHESYLVDLSLDNVVCNSSFVGGSKLLLFFIFFFGICFPFFSTTFRKSEAFIFGISLVVLLLGGALGCMGDIGIGGNDGGGGGGGIL